MAKDERVCLLCVTGIVEVKRQFLFQCPAYDALRCQFRDLFLCGPNLALFLKQNYGLIAAYLSASSPLHA